MIRYAIYRRDNHGSLVLASPNQGRFFHDSELGAKLALRDLRASMEDKLGYHGLVVKPVDCYENGDAKSIYANPVRFEEGRS